MSSMLFVDNDLADMVAKSCKCAYFGRFYCGFDLLFAIIIFQIYPVEGRRTLSVKEHRHSNLIMVQKK